jgi:hypothetical protein
MTTLKHQDGTIATGLFVAVIIAIFVGVGIWTVWRNRTPPDQLTNTSQNNGASDTASQKNNTTEPTAAVTAAQEKLTISEWGIAFEPPSYLQGEVSYAINTTAARDFGGPERVDLMVARISNSSLQCDVQNTSPKAVVSFYKSADGTGATAQSTDTIKTINANHYVFTTTACEEAISSSGTPEQQKILSDLKSSVKESLQAVTQ